MARDLAPAAVLAKWIGTPVVLAVVGYFVVGPLLGHMGKHLPAQVRPLVADAEKKIPVLRGATNQQKPIQADVADPDAVDTSAKDEPSVDVKQKPVEKQASPSSASDGDSGPDVEVSVESASVPTSSATHRRHRTKKTHHTTPKPKPADPEMTDPASFGGTQDTGTPPAGGTNPPDGN